MKAFLDAVVDAGVGLPAGALIGGVLLSMLLALPVACAYAASLSKARNAATHLVALAMAANLCAMATAAGYVRWTMDESGVAPEMARPAMVAAGPWGSALPVGMHPPEGVGMAGSPAESSSEIAPAVEAVARLLIAGADTDLDAAISTEEAGAAAARFVEMRRTGSLGYFELVAILTARVKQAELPPYPAPDTRPAGRPAAAAGHAERAAGLAPLSGRALPGRPRG